MALDIHTGNKTGGDSVFKAMGHPLTADAMPGLLARLGERGAVALYDPFDQLGVLPYTTSPHSVDAVRAVDRGDRGEAPRPGSVGFGPSQVESSNASGGDVRCGPPHQPHPPLDPRWYDGRESRRGSNFCDLLTNKRKYLDKLNFATNLGFLRDANGRHSRIVTANYWSSYSNQPASIWCRLFDSDGVELATWMDALPGPSGNCDRQQGHPVALWPRGLHGHRLHACGGGCRADIVKYALDTYGDAAEELSCTHDANAWPADLYAGLPAQARASG